MTESKDVLAVLRRGEWFVDDVCDAKKAIDAVAELIAAATELRQHQRDYLSGPKSERSEEKGRLVGVAASRVDAALAACTPAKEEGR